MSDFLLGISVTLFVMIFLNHKYGIFKSKPKKVLIWVAVVALILSLVFSLEDIVRGVKDGMDFGIENTNTLRT
ncbi:MAG: hypothetical protein WD016_09680 [Balneolaceae bacterium]